jgi:hypothetical protein
MRKVPWCLVLVFLLTFVLFFLPLFFPPLFRLHSAQTSTFVDGLFDMNRDLKAYKHHLRDFLIQVLVSINWFDVCDFCFTRILCPNQPPPSSVCVVFPLSHSPISLLSLLMQEFRADEGGVEVLFAEEKAAKDAEELERRKAVPGLIAPHQLPANNEEEDDI